MHIGIPKAFLRYFLKNMCLCTPFADVNQAEINWSSRQTYFDINKHKLDNIFEYYENNSIKGTGVQTHICCQYRVEHIISGHIYSNNIFE